MFNRGEMDFDVALVSMKHLGQVFQPVGATWIRFRCVDGVVEHWHELSMRWIETESIPCSWIVGKWVEALP